MISARQGGGSDCCLCAQIAGRPAGDLLHRLLGMGSYERRVALESDRAAVVPSLGPLASGHVLVCPKPHHRSVAALPAEQRRELLALADTTTGLLADLYAEPVHRFEHGDASAGHEISCSVEHAHLHLLPTAADPWDSLRDELSWTRLPGRDAVPELARGREYLYYERPDGTAFVHIGSDPLPSQLLRLRFAEGMGDPGGWNWRASPHPDLTAANYAELRHAAVSAGLATESVDDDLGPGLDPEASPAAQWVVRAIDQP